MTEDELTIRVKERAGDPKQRTTSVQFSPRLLRQPRTAAEEKALDLSNRLETAFRPRARLKPYDPLPVCVTSELVRETESALGFRLPPLLARLWIEVGNGGFGPGYGLFGLEGGHLDDAERLTLPELYLSRIEDDSWERFLGQPWPARLVPICDWGCQHQSALDCSTVDGQVVDLIDSYDRKPRGVSFAQWMEDWVTGVKLWAH